MVSAPFGTAAIAGPESRPTDKHRAGFPGFDSTVESRWRPRDATKPTERRADLAISRWIVKLECSA